MDQKVLEAATAILGDLRCSSLKREGTSEIPKFSGLTDFLAMYYKQLLPWFHL